VLNKYWRASEAALYPLLVAGVAKLVDATDLGEFLSAREETRDAELLKVGETFNGNPEPSPETGRCRD